MLKEERPRFVSERPSGGVELEGRLFIPGEGRECPGAVLCHPHPAGGGEMHVHLLRVIQDELDSAGFATLRFNFGGVGGSAGRFTDGAEEPFDVISALGFLGSQPMVDANRMSLVGWSFGAWMALLALEKGASARRCVAIAPPLAAVDWDDHAHRIAVSAASRSYIVGEDDQFCPVQTLNDFASIVSFEDRSNVTVLRHADHFLFGREDEVARTVGSLLA